MNRLNYLKETIRTPTTSLREAGWGSVWCINNGDDVLLCKGHVNSPKAALIHHQKLREDLVLVVDHHLAVRLSERDHAVAKN